MKEMKILEIADLVGTLLSLLFVTSSLVVLRSFIQKTTTSVKQQHQQWWKPLCDRQTDRRADRQSTFQFPTSATDTPFDDIYLINGNDWIYSHGNLIRVHSLSQPLRRSDGFSCTQSAILRSVAAVEGMLMEGGFHEWGLGCSKEEN